MSFQTYLLIVICVVGIAAGQVLFKISARALQGEWELWRVVTQPALLAGLTIYGVATIAWIWQLRYVNLSQAYPLMALSFILVPLASQVFLGEHINERQWLGSTLIVVGIVLTMRQ